ncbi:hypothetical protein os1_26150 [Comamonadaceae bacterium OS-1]|nr:hypothetical protein os1_26150 [Comamonadaceae bacterium OS-1]
MKSALHQPAKATAPSTLQVPGALLSGSKGKVQATSIILKSATDAKRQHTAIGKLVKMCNESAVTTAAKGITTEVRRDRDRGHD